MRRSYDIFLFGLALLLVTCVTFIMTDCEREIKVTEECQKQCLPYDFALHNGKCYCETTRKAN